MPAVEGAHALLAVVAQLVLGDGLVLPALQPERHYNPRVLQEQAALIVTDPAVVHGQARIRGTRIPVSVVLDCLAAGLGEDEILGQYPTLTIEGVRAAAAYGAALAREEIAPLLA